MEDPGRHLASREAEVGRATAPAGAGDGAPRLAGAGDTTRGRSLAAASRPVHAAGGGQGGGGQRLALVQPSFSEVGARFVEAEAEVVRAKLALEQAEVALKRIEKLVKAEAEVRPRVAGGGVRPENGPGHV